MQSFLVVSIVAILSTTFSHYVTGIPLANFYPFGSTNGDTALPPNDDGSSAPITLSMPFTFFDETRAMVFVNNNGVISFQRAVSQFTPDSFPLPDDLELIAPYWADVDTRGTGTVWYRETNDAVLRARAADDVRAAFISQSTFFPIQLFIATWERVGYFSQNTDLLNTFQCVMATDGINSFVIFLYADGEIQWTTGDASGGTGGLGGTQAQVGFNAGDGIRFASVPGSQTAEIINIDTTSNIGIPGVWIFRVDEEDIAIGGCSFEPIVTLEIAPRSGHVLGGTAVLITGPCLEETDNITCVFDGMEVEGLFVSMMLALCVSPPLTEIGRRPLQLIVHDTSGIRSQGTTEFVSLPFDVGFAVQLDEPDLLFVPRSSFTITWSPNVIIPSVDPNSYTVDIGLYCFNEASNTFTEVAILASDILNSGNAVVTMPSVIAGFSDVCIFSIEVMVGGTNDIAIGKRQTVPDLVSRLIELAASRSGIWSVVGYLTFSLSLRALCEAWCATQPANIGQTLINQVLACPPTLRQAMIDNRFEMENILISRTFHPGTDRCFRQIIMNREGECSPGSQCCYDFDGRLITGPPNGGTIDRASPQGRLRCYLEHFVVDVLPSIYCCVGIFADCGSYYRKRPSRAETGYQIPVPACVYGDPHLVTLDGFKYTFNGRGEFVLVETADNRFTLQGRMVDAVDASGNSVAATVFSAVVCRQNDSDTVQFEVSRRGVDVLVNGALVDFQTLPQQIEFTNVILTDLGNNTVSAQFSSGAFIQVTEELEILSQLFFSLPDTFQGVTKGLLGSFNGDTSDDFLPRFSDTPLPTTSSLQDIHFQFGVTWIVNNSADSLFTYAAGESFATFFDPTFSPVFQPTFSDPGLEAQADAICGDDLFCRFDIAATGRTDIGLSTLVGSQTFDDIVALSTAIICDPPCVNGACVANDTCNCAAGFDGNTCNETVITECTQAQNLCENGGTCQFQMGSFFCECPPGFSGTLCENRIVTETTLGDDPHFSIVLPESNKILCYTVQGEHGFAFNLISNKKLHMNAKFVADSKRSEVTWIGSLGIVVKNAHYLGSNVTKLRFDAKSKEIYIENKVILNAKKIDGLTLCNGKLTINEAPPNKKTETCSVRVVFTDIGLNFTINFVKEHLDMFWHSVGGQDKDSHGLIGQFFRKNVEIDEARKILILRDKEPVPVMRRPVWSFMEREKHDDRFCWAAMNEGYQGKGLIDGNYLDYLVDDVLSSDFGYKH